MTKLVKYDAARLALAEALAVDEVQKIRNQAEAMRVYARQAEDKSLEVDAAEIRLRAERRLGELIAAQKATVGLNQGARVAGAKPGANDGSSAVVAHDRRPTLAEAGISKDLSSRAQKIAAVPDDEFEAAVDDWRADVSAAGAKVRTRLEEAGARATKKRKAEPEPAPRDELEDAVAALTEENNRLLEENDTLRRAADPDAVTKISQLKAYINTVESQRDDWMNQCAMLKREVKRLHRQLGVAHAA
ncbi:MAG: hypothetical protein RBT86_07115 [Azospira sp.]|jgi:hypothetical protein|nr:hypothetical protein [Azospira sp.]